MFQLKLRTLPFHKPYFVFPTRNFVQDFSSTCTSSAIVSTLTVHSLWGDMTKKRKQKIVKASQSWVTQITEWAMTVTKLWTLLFQKPYPDPQLSSISLSPSPFQFKHHLA